MSRFFHVTSVANRESIRTHGLDWNRMGPARGIAGSHFAEVEGCFLGDEYEVEIFVRMNNTGGPVDVWAVDGLDEEHLVTSRNGYTYFPGRVSAESLTLVRSPDFVRRTDAGSRPRG